MYIFMGCSFSGRATSENLLIEFSDEVKNFQYFMRIFADKTPDIQTSFRLLSIMRDSTETVEGG